jgi:16S rRNA U516 pseudouridylate synthase RsuA-like enzyme
MDRLQKVIAQAGATSRRKADEYQLGFYKSGYDTHLKQQIKFLFNEDVEVLKGVVK